MGIAESKRKLQLKIPTMKANYASGVGQWLGADVSGSIPVAAYGAKIGPATADKWERNLKQAFGV